MNRLVIWAMPDGPRLAVLRHRSRIRVSALSGAIAIAVAGCSPLKPEPAEWRECVDTLTHETFRFNTANAEVYDGIFSTSVVLTDTDGFKRIIRDDSHLKCRTPKAGAQ